VRQVVMEKRKWNETRVAMVMMDGWRWDDANERDWPPQNVEVETCLDIFVVCRACFAKWRYR
jgi:hypothetical protein